MGYFNYFIKSFIRIFTRKFFWIILVFILLFVGLIFVDKVNAETVKVDFTINGVSYSINITLTNDLPYYTFLYNEENGKLIYTKSGTSTLYFRVRNPNSGENQNIGYIDYYSSSHYGFLQNSFTWGVDLSNMSFYGNSTNSASYNDRGLLELSHNSRIRVVASNRNVVYNQSSFSILNNSGVLYDITDKKLSWLTSYAQMCDLNYDYLSIDGNALQYFKDISILGSTSRIYADITFFYTYEGQETSFKITPDFIVWSGNGDTNVFVINIPKDYLHAGVNLRPNTFFEYRVEYKFPFPDPENPVISTLDTSGELTYVFTQEEADEQNKNSDKYLQMLEEQQRQEQLRLQQEQLIQQQQQTQELQNINNSINNPNVDNSVLGDMPQASTIQDNTGISAIFQQMYNAFCTNQVISFTLDVPFVNESITIDSDYSNNYPVQLRTMAGVFWWFVIGLFVLKDVRSIINKIAEGNVENVGSDVQKEVL